MSLESQIQELWDESYHPLKAALPSLRGMVIARRNGKGSFLPWIRSRAVAESDEVLEFDRLGINLYDHERGLSLGACVDIDIGNHGLTVEQGHEVEARRPNYFTCSNSSTNGWGRHWWSLWTVPISCDEARHREMGRQLGLQAERDVGLPFKFVDVASNVLWVIAHDKAPNGLQGECWPERRFDPTKLTQASDTPSEFTSVEMTSEHRRIAKAIGATVEHTPEGIRLQFHSFRVQASRIAPGFATVSTGRHLDQPNAFGYLLPDGKVLICRHGNVAEPTWQQSARGTYFTIIGGEAEDYSPVSVGTLVERHPQLAEPVIDGLLRLGETMNVIAPPKAGKSWLTLCLLLSIATGRPLFGFPTRKGKTLLIDNELSPALIASRLPQVAHAMGLRPEEYRDELDVISLRGRLLDLNGVDHNIVSRLQGGEYSCVVADALYRFNPGGTEGENSNAAITKSFNLIDSFATRMNAAWVLIHHATKGDQREKSITDVGAGAGSMSRAADAHLVLRDHELDGHAVLEAVVRSFPPPKPVVLHWEFPLWHVAEGADPNALRDPKAKRQQANDESGCEAILSALKSSPLPVRGIMGATGMGRDRINKLLGRLVVEGAVTYTEDRRGGKLTHVYEVVA